MPAAPVGAYTPNELWYWNGAALNQPYWNISTWGGSRMGIPTLRGQDYQVPYRSGQNWRAKYLDSRTITLVMWTDGQMSGNQAYPSPDGRRAFNDNWQALRAMFFTRTALGSVQGQLTRNWYLTVGGTPTMVSTVGMAEIAGSMDPTMNGRTSAAFSVDLLMSDPYFYGPTRGQGITGTGTITAAGEGIVGEGYASLINGFTISLTQAATVTNTTAGVSFTHSGAGVASWPVVVDVFRYTAVDNAGNNVVGGITHAGSRMWQCLLPGANAFTVNHGTATFAWMDAYI